MTMDRYPQIKRRIKNQLANYYGNPKIMSRNFHWVVQMYLYYAWRAVINGWTIKINSSADRPSMKLTLKKEPVRKLEEREKGKYFISNKLFGDMFSINMSGDQVDPEYIWTPCKELSEMLQDSLDTDNIYELVKS